MLSRAPFDEEEFAHEIGVRGVRGEKGYTSQERRSIRPCLDVNGIVGGFTAEGSKTIIPKEARAKVSMRLVPNQRCGKIAELFRKHIKSIAPSDVTVEVYENHGCDGFLIPVSSPAYKAASRAMGEVYGIEPVPARGGGSIEPVSKTSASFSNFHLVFMMRLSRFIGFFPNVEQANEGGYFDLINGCFTDRIPDIRK